MGSDQSTDAHAPVRTAVSAPVRTPVAERDPRTGHFLPGNQIAADHQGRTRAAELRRALQAAVTPEDIHNVMRAMISEACAGNAFAANLVLDRVLGKVQPAAPEDAQDTSALLARLWKEWAAPKPGGPSVEDASFKVKEEAGGEPGGK